MSKQKMVDINVCLPKFDFEIELSENQTRRISLDFCYPTRSGSGNPPLSEYRII